MRKICFCLAVLTVLFFAVSCDSKGSGAKAAENTGNDGDTVSTNDDDSTETITDDSDTVDDSEITDSGDSRSDENDTTPDEDLTDTEAAGGDDDTACDEDSTDTEAAGDDEDTACDEDLTDTEVSDGDDDAACNEAINPVISDIVDLRVDETAAPEAQTVNVARAVLPEGTVNESLLDDLEVVAGSLEAHRSNDGSDSLDALLAAAPVFAIDADGQITCQYTPLKNVYGSQEFTITVKTDCGGSASFEWTITVEPVNDAPVAAYVDWNVSISSLLRSPSFDFNTVVSDIDNDSWRITALVLGEIAVDVEGTQTTVTVNNIDLQAVYDPTAKTLTLYAPDGFDLAVLDKHSLALAYTVNDNSTSGELTADGTGTVAFTICDAAYNEQAQDTVRTIDVSANDRPNWEQEGKTFTLSEVSALSDESAGSVAIVDGVVKYTQAADYRGTVTFTYTIVNDNDPTETATLTVAILVKAINAVPTAAAVNVVMDESLSGDDTVPLNFADAVADRETAAGDLKIAINEADVVNGTLVGNDGNALPVVGGVISFNANDTVYFKPDQYCNGETTIPYAVTDSLDDLAGYTLVAGETAKTATSNVVVTVSPVGIAPTVELEDASTDEIAGGAEQTTIQIGTASMPAGAESLAAVSAESTDINAHINDSDTQDSLITDYSFDLDAETGTITFTYTLIEHVWGTQTFEVTVTSVEGGTETVEWTITVNPVNDSPEVQVAAEGRGGKKSDIQVSFSVEDIETPTADLTYTLTTVPAYGTLYKDGETMGVGDTFTTGNSITYRVNDGVPEDITGDSFGYKVTDRGADAGLTEADSITIENLTGTIEFNQAPVINDYVGTKTVDTSAGAQSGSWLLFNLSDVVDPEGETINKDNIELSGDAYWNGDSAYIDYNFDQGDSGSNEATVTITDPIDDSVTSEYEFKLTALSGGEK